MRLFDICTRKVYIKDGESKEKWYRAGLLKETDKGTMYIRLYNQPDTDFYLFEKADVGNGEEKIIKY